MRLLGQRCLVTGASSGIGAAIANGLAREGAAVVGAARRFAAAPLPPSLVNGEVARVQLNVSDESGVTALFASLDRVDVLVNCAGSGAFASMCDAQLADLRDMLDAHIVGTWLCCRAALRRMAARRRGHIVTVSSTAAIETFADAGSYTAAKSGQSGLTRVVRQEARASGVRVTELIPGAVDTPLWDRRPDFDRTKMLTAEQVAKVCVELLACPGAESVVMRPLVGDL